MTAVVTYPTGPAEIKSALATALQGDETVYLLDYSGPPGFAAEISKLCKRCVVLDHHKTAAAELCTPSTPLPPNLEVTFDMDRSGATIALDYFKPQQLTDDQLLFFKYIEDSDLWRWALPGSREFYAGLLSLQLEYDCRANPQIFDQLLALTPAEVISRGRIEMDRQQRCINDAIATAFVVNLGGGKGSAKGWGQALAVNVTPAVARIRSELGNALADEASRRGLQPVGLVVYREPEMDDNDVKVSVRSVGDFDTTAVSQAHGGGGHKNASSFLIDNKQFESWKA